MITDPLPRVARKRDEYLRSEGAARPALPPADPFREATRRLFSAVEAGEPPPVRRACQALADQVVAFHGVTPVEVGVLGVRPHRVVDGAWSYQLFGDYTPGTRRIRVWMRTAIRARIASPKAVLNTLLHELCHHLDCAALGLPDTFHTRGFFGRIDDLYHHALATPESERRSLHWIRSGARWRIDWTRSRTRGG